MPTPQKPVLRGDMTLQNLDKIDPEAADRVRARMGMPLKHAKKTAPKQAPAPVQESAGRAPAAAKKTPPTQRARAARVAVPDPFTPSPARKTGGKSSSSK